MGLSQEEVAVTPGGEGVASYAGGQPRRPAPAATEQARASLGAWAPLSANYSHRREGVLGY